MERIDDTGWLATEPRTWWKLWLAAFVGWTAYALVFAVQVVGMSEKMGEPYLWPDVLRTSLVGMWGWVPLTVALFWLVDRLLGCRAAAEVEQQGLDLAADLPAGRHLPCRAPDTGVR